MAISRMLLGALALMAAPAALAAETAPADVKMVDQAVAAALTDKPGDPAEGAKTVATRTLGNCVACHAVKALPKESFQGDIGPALDGAGSRWTPEQLRAIIVNSKAALNPDTIMPGFYTADPAPRVLEKFKGATILTAQQVEDVAAWLSTLKE